MGGNGSSKVWLLRRCVEPNTGELTSLRATLNLLTCFFVRVRKSLDDNIDKLVELRNPNRLGANEMLRRTNLISFVVETD